MHKIELYMCFTVLEYAASRIGHTNWGTILFLFFLSLPRLVIRCLIKNFNFSRKLTNKQNTKSCDTGFGAAHQRCFKGSRRSRPPLLLHSRTRDRPDAGTRREAHFSWSKAPCDGGEFRQPVNVFFFFSATHPSVDGHPFPLLLEDELLNRCIFLNQPSLHGKSTSMKKGGGKKSPKRGRKMPPRARSKE